MVHPRHRHCSGFRCAGRCADMGGRTVKRYICCGTGRISPTVPAEDQQGWRTEEHPAHPGSGGDSAVAPFCGDAFGAEFLSDSVSAHCAAIFDRLSADVRIVNLSALFDEERQSPIPNRQKGQWVALDRIRCGVPRISAGVCAEFLPSVADCDGINDGMVFGALRRSGAICDTPIYHSGLPQAIVGRPEERLRPVPLAERCRISGPAEGGCRGL